jgi:outer membrane protein TolC
MRISAPRRVLIVLALLIAATAAHADDPPRLAPETPTRPWKLPTTTLSGDATAEIANSLVDPAKEYDLPALIDLAQRSNPQTREAWERARQAALAVGLIESAYLPQISAEALAGYQRTPLPIPATLIPKGYFTSDTRELVPSLAVKWLLFDFGRREHAEQAARENSFVANVAFTGAHQQLIFAVSRAYHAYGAAHGKQRAAEKALQRAQVDRDSVQARRANGLATTVEVAKAQRQVAQAKFNAARAIGGERTAYVTLLADVGIAPTTEIRIAQDASASLPTAPVETLSRHVEQALANRPDIIAGLGKQRAAQETVEKERAEHRPTISLLAQAYQNIGALNSDGGPYSHVNKPGGALFVQFSMPLFDGHRRDTQIAIARSEEAAASDQIDAARHTAAKEVAEAYFALTTAIAEHEAAGALVEAAHAAHDAGAESYRRGLGTFTSLVDDEDALVQAETELEDASASVRTAAVGLALATGRIGSAEPSQ